VKSISDVLSVTLNLKSINQSVDHSRNDEDQWVIVLVRDVKRSSNFRTSILKFEFDLRTFGIRILFGFALHN